MEKIVKISPAFDKRSNNPKKDYGISACHIWFILKGKMGAVQVMLGTDWYLPETIAEYKEIGNKGKTKPCDLRGDKEFLKCWDVGYHAKKQQYKGQRSTPCDILKGKCYYDGSSLIGEDDKVVKMLLERGSDWIWKYLEKEYEIRFGKEEIKYGKNGKRIKTESKGTPKEKT